MDNLILHEYLLCFCLKIKNKYTPKIRKSTSLASVHTMNRIEASKAQSFVYCIVYTPKVILYTNIEAIGTIEASPNPTKSNSAAIRDQSSSI